MNVNKRLFQYALGQKWAIISALVMLVISVGAELMGPIIAKQIIDDHIIGANSYEGEMSAIFQLAGKYMLFILLSALFAYGQKYYLEISANRIIKKNA